MKTKEDVRISNFDEFLNELLERLKQALEKNTAFDEFLNELLGRWKQASEKNTASLMDLISMVEKMRIEIPKKGFSIDKLLLILGLPKNLKGFTQLSAVLNKMLTGGSFKEACESLEGNYILNMRTAIGKAYVKPTKLFNELFGEFDKVPDVEDFVKVVITYLND